MNNVLEIREVQRKDEEIVRHLLDELEDRVADADTFHSIFKEYLDCLLYTSPSPRD